MIKIALKMLHGDRAKYIGIVLGITFSSLVITQQLSIFSGIMKRTYGFLSDTTLPDIWVMDPKVTHFDDNKPMQDTQLLRVRGVEGVAWAMPLYKGLLKARLANGTFQNCIVIGVDDATLIGGPSEMVEGRLEDLRISDGVIVDVNAAKGRLAKAPKVSGGKPVPLIVGDTLELNDHRAIVVGLAKTSRAFQSQPMIFTVYSRATTFAPRERKLLTYITVKAKPDENVSEVAKKITQATGLKALTAEEFKQTTMSYYLKYTGIPINFGIAVILGFVVGAAICGQTFFNFTLDNLRYFGTLKAMGASTRMLLGMIIVQALVVGLVGYGLGVGIASLFYYVSQKSELAFYLPWQVLGITGLAVTAMCTIAALISMRSVIKLEPAIVFRT